MTRPYRCDGCGVSFNRRPMAPMLADAAWLRLAGDRDRLCAECMFARAFERRVALTVMDLRVCEFNQRQGWFELFERVARERRCMPYCYPFFCPCLARERERAR